MSIIRSDIVVYGSANMRETDADAQGGAIAATTRVVFEDLSANDAVQVVSSNAGDDDTNTVTVYGRNAGGSLVSEATDLNGQTPATGTQVFERLMKCVITAGTPAGDVAVERQTATRDNTAQGGGDATASEAAYITLDAGASAEDDAYNGMVVRLNGGTGSGQIRRIVDYVGSTKTAYVAWDWDTTPDATSEFVVSEGVVFKNGETTVRRPFYNVSADVEGGSERNYYEKVFLKNTNAANSLLGMSVTEEADPSTKITFALEDAVDDNGTSDDRVTAPAGIGAAGFTSDAKTLDDEAGTADLAADSAIGVWLKLTLSAGDAATKTTYTIGTSGSTT
jgi:hypothetical protein